MWFHPSSSLSPQLQLCYHLVHATWTWIYPRDLELELSTQLGIGLIYPHDLELDLSTRNFSRSCSPQLLFDLDYCCLDNPMFVCVAYTLRPATSMSTSWPSTCTRHPSASVSTMPACWFQSALCLLGLSIWLASSFLVYLCLFLRLLSPDTPCMAGGDMGGPLQEKSVGEKRYQEMYNCSIYK